MHIGGKAACRVANSNAAAPISATWMGFCGTAEDGDEDEGVGDGGRDERGDERGDEGERGDAGGRSGRDEVSEDGEVWGVISSTEDEEGVVAESGRLSVG